MDVRKILLASIALLLLAGMAAAIDCPGYGIKSGEHPIGITTAESGGCFKFKWTRSNDIDFNNYIVNVDSTYDDHDLADTNYTGNEYNICPVTEGESVTLQIYAYDGNAEGHFCGPDYNAKIGIGTVVDSGRYFTYTLLIVFGSIIGALLMVGVAMYAIRKMDISVLPFKK